MRYQNSLQGIPKSTVYCKVGATGGFAGTDLPMVYDRNSDSQTSTTLGLSDTRNMHQNGYFIAPEPGIYWFCFSIFSTGASTSEAYVRDAVTGRYVIKLQPSQGISGVRSFQLIGTVLLTGNEKLFFAATNLNADAPRPESNMAEFIKLYDLPDF